MKHNIIIFIIIFGISSCNDSKNTNEEVEYEVYTQKTEEEEEEVIPSYVNENHHFSIKIPEGWRVFESDSADQIQTINIYRSKDSYKLNFPLDIHVPEDVSHISLFPLGLGTELPFGITKILKNYKEEIPLNFSLNEEESYLFLLENAQVHAYFLKPLSPPPGWNEDGFLFIQTQADGFYGVCYNNDTGVEKKIEECDPLAGDKIKKYGDLNLPERTKIMEILSSLYFFQEDSLQDVPEELVQLESPFINAQVTSPLVISGKARKEWYGEGSFPIEIVNSDFQVIGKGLAKPEQTNAEDIDLVPFQVEIVFDKPINERGYIVLREGDKDKVEYRRSRTVPIIFPTVVNEY